MLSQQTFYDNYHKKNNNFYKVIKRNNFTYYEIIRFFYSKILPKLANLSKLKILDIGCGVGTMALYFGSLGIIVRGIDISSRAIKIAKNAKDHLKFKNVSFSKSLLQKGKKNYDIESDIQDMLSTLYYLREVNFDTLKIGDVISVKMFFDQETYKTNIELLKREVLKTKFGKVKTLVFRPAVVEGRVFDDKETVTLWITDDKNKIPIKIKASILVGSLKAELIQYKGLANSFPIIFN